MPRKPLTVGMVGEHVAELQETLTRLGLAVPEAETKRRFFGPATLEALKSLQTTRGLPATGDLDDLTHELLQAARSGNDVFARQPGGDVPIAKTPIEEPTKPTPITEMPLAREEPIAALSGRLASPRAALLADALGTVPRAERLSAEELNERNRR